MKAEVLFDCSDINVDASVDRSSDGVDRLGDVRLATLHLYWRNGLLLVHQHYFLHNAIIV